MPTPHRIMRFYGVRAETMRCYGIHTGLMRFLRILFYGVRAETMRFLRHSYREHYRTPSVFRKYLSTVGMKIAAASGVFHRRNKKKLHDRIF